MCEPTVAITVASTMLSTATGIMSKYSQDKAQSKAAAYNAQAAEEQAATERTLAQNEIQKGISERSRQQRNAMRQMGEMRAGIGASGFEMDSGTMVSLLEESATEHQYDSNIIDQNAKQSAWGHLVSANSAENSASLYRNQAKGSSNGSLLQIGGSLLGGIASSMQTMNAFNKAKTPAGSSTNSSGSFTPFTAYPFNNNLSQYGSKK